MKLGTTLIAGLAITIATPALSAQANTTGWSLMASDGSASHYGCRISDSTGSTVNTYLSGASAGVAAGLVVVDPKGVVVDSWSSVGSIDPNPSGHVYLPGAKGYYVMEWFSVSVDEVTGGSISQKVSIQKTLAHCRASVRRAGGAKGVAGRSNVGVAEPA